MNWQYIDAGIILGLAAIAAPVIVRFNVWFYRRLGLIRDSRYWDLHLGTWIRNVRLLCAVAAVALLVLGVTLR